MAPEVEGLLGPDSQQARCRFPVATKADPEAPARWIDEQGLVVPPHLTAAVPKRQAEFMAGRVCLRQALSALGHPAPPIVSMGPDRAPLWPQGYRGAISHTHGLAWAAAARTSTHHGLGIDVERRASERQAQALEAQVLLEEERPLVGACGLDRRAHLTLVFSAKESLYKCLYPAVLRFFGFAAARLEDLDPGAGTFTWVLAEDLAQDLPAGARGGGRFLVDDTHVWTAIEWTTGAPSA